MPTMTARSALAAMMMTTMSAAGLAAQDLAHARASLRAADSAHAAAVRELGVVEGLPAAFADQVLFLREGADVVHGLEGVRADLPGSPLAGARLAWTTLRADVSADGTHGYTYGAGTYAAADGTPRFSRTLAYWHMDEGEWKVLAFVLNLPGRPAQPVPAGFVDESAPPRFGPREVEGMMQADRDFSAQSVAQGPAAAFRNWAAPDGILLGGPFYGPQALYEIMGPGGGTLEWGPTAATIAPSGDLGFTVGIASSKADDGTRGYTKYLTVWRLQPDGAWRFVADGGNARPAPRS
jgi:hypothetical protein